MSNLTKSEREGLNELFCYLEVSNCSMYKRILLKLNHFLVFIKVYIIR